MANVSMDFDILGFFFPADLHMDLYIIVLKRTRLFLHWLCAHCRAEALCSVVQSS